MSTKNSTGHQSAGTTDDAPTLEPTLTTVVTEHAANGGDGELLAFQEFSAAVSCATDTVHRLVEDC